MIKIISKVIGFSFLPIFLAYCANSNQFLIGLQNNGIIGTQVDIPQLKDRLLLVSIFLQVFLLSIPFAISEIKKKRVLAQRKHLIKYNKDIFLISLAKMLDIQQISLDIRIFVPREIRSHDNLFQLKKEFKIINIEGLADRGVTDKLSFQVHPTQEGLVGICYNSKSFVFDDTLGSRQKPKYNYVLTDFQKSKTNNIKFIICSPIFDAKDKIVAIVAFDSTERITIPADKEDDLEIYINSYTQTLYEYIPDFFK